MSQRQGRGRPPGLSAELDDFNIFLGSTVDRELERIYKRAHYTKVDRMVQEALLRIKAEGFGMTDRVRREMAPMQPAMIPAEKKRKRVPGMEGLN